MILANLDDLALEDLPVQFNLRRIENASMVSILHECYLATCRENEEPLTPLERIRYGQRLHPEYQDTLLRTADYKKIQILTVEGNLSRDLEILCKAAIVSAAQLYQKFAFDVPRYLEWDKSGVDKDSTAEIVQRLLYQLSFEEEHIIRVKEGIQISGDLISSFSANCDYTFALQKDPVAQRLHYTITRMNELLTRRLWLDVPELQDVATLFTQNTQGEKHPFIYFGQQE